MTQLHQLLTDEEEAEITRRGKLGLNKIDLNTPIGDLTISDLSAMSTILLRTEYGGQMVRMHGSLSCESINILTKRAIDWGIDLF